MKTLTYIDTGYACFGLIASDNVVTDAAPIANWARGKDLNEVVQYYKTRKNAEVLILCIVENNNGKEQKEEKAETGGQSDE